MYAPLQNYKSNSCAAPFNVTQKMSDVWMQPDLPVSLSVCPSVCHFVSISINLSVCLAVRQSVNLSVSLSVCPSI